VNAVRALALQWVKFGDEACSSHRARFFLEYHVVSLDPLGVLRLEKADESTRGLVAEKRFERPPRGPEPDPAAY
jgi:hypothetical protein